MLDKYLNFWTYLNPHYESCTVLSTLVRNQSIYFFIHMPVFSSLFVSALNTVKFHGTYCNQAQCCKEWKVWKGECNCLYFMQHLPFLIALGHPDQQDGCELYLFCHSVFPKLRGCACGLPLLPGWHCYFITQSPFLFPSLLLKPLLLHVFFLFTRTLEQLNYINAK